MKTIGIIGAGASGIFAAISLKESHPDAMVIVFEQQANILQKVKISGGGRCNVTHACFNYRDLIDFYPRGGKPLLSLFSQFDPNDTIQWFQDRGVTLITEDDGRMFPNTHSSQTIIDCFIRQIKHHGIAIQTQKKVTHVHKKNGFHIKFSDQTQVDCDVLVLTTGSSRNGVQIAQSLGHQISPQVASLFTFKARHPKLNALAGISIQQVKVGINQSHVPEQFGPLLITHSGFSGPSIIKSSAWGAIELHQKEYRFTISIHFLPAYTHEQIRHQLIQFKDANPHKQCQTRSPFAELPLRFWRFIMHELSIDSLCWKQCTQHHLESMMAYLTHAQFSIDGKNNFKEEFVTAGGIQLCDIDLKTMQSRHCPNLYFAGEILNIDGVTGGFNFQNAWTTAKQITLSN